MANNNNTPVKVDMVEYRLPDTTLQLPTWEYLSTEISKLCYELNGQLETQNEYLESIVDTIDTWPKKTDPNNNQQPGE